MSTEDVAAREERTEEIFGEWVAHAGASGDVAATRSLARALAVVESDRDDLAARLQEAERIAASVRSKTALDVVAEKMAAEDRAEATEDREAALREALSEMIYGSSIGTLHKARQVARAALAADPESEEAPK